MSLCAPASVVNALAAHGRDAASPSSTEEREPMERIDLIGAEREISAVLRRYARSADRHDWEGVRSCFHPDATDDHLDYKGDIDGLIAYLAERHVGLEMSVHQLGNVDVEVRSAEDAVSETYCLTAQRRRGADGGPGEDLFVFSRYIDRFERRDSGPWLIAQRAVAMSFARTEAVGAGFADPGASPAGWLMGSFGADDPVYTQLGCIFYS